jgi:hypothetical protein
VSTLLGLLTFVITQTAWAYPEFIGYNYTSCLTCHYNGHGNGALSDYGRALWASEIAGKLFNPTTSDEALGESSGFLGKKKIPDWFRPGIKARYMIYKPNPPNGVERSILMQMDINAAIFFDKDQKYGVVMSYGALPDPASPNPNAKKTISREHYFRWQVSEKIWNYFGKLDKVYGIRTVNHTAYSRSRTGIGQNDQSYGYVFHYVKEHLEGTFNYFLGDLDDDTSPTTHQKGFSTMFEYDPVEAWRIGVSFLSSESETVKNQRIGIHSKQGFGEGNSLLLELGMITDTPTNGVAKDGYYFYSQATQRLTRGYSLFFAGQGYKDELKGSRPNNIKASVGLIMFPMQRFEFRVEAENARQLTNDAAVPEDSWGIISQVHMSL